MAVLICSMAMLFSTLPQSCSGMQCPYNAILLPSKAVHDHCESKGAPGNNSQACLWQSLAYPMCACRLASWRPLYLFLRLGHTVSFNHITRDPCHVHFSSLPTPMLQAIMSPIAHVPGVVAPLISQTGCVYGRELAPLPEVFPSALQTVSLPLVSAMCGEYRYCSELLIDAYRWPDVDSKQRNYTYIAAVTRYLGKHALCTISSLPPLLWINSRVLLTPTCSCMQYEL